MAYDLALHANCRKFLSRNRRKTPAEFLKELSHIEEAGLPADHYAVGGAVEVLERHIAQLLGKEAALFFSTGTAAQHAVVKAHCARLQRAGVVVHRMSHMYHDTAKGLEQLLDIMPVAVGDRAPFTVEDLSAVAEHPAVVAVELPLRRSGFLLPEWSQLEAVSRWARGAGAAFHIDGARLWEASAGYERSLADIAALADSVYVSFYKGIGGMAGAMVAGDSEFIERLKPWRIRFGARLQTSFPIALAALSGIKKHLPKQTGYLTRAHALAGALNSAGFSCAPTPPHISSFRVFFDGEPATLRRAHEQFARETGVWLFDDMFQLPGEPAFGEIVIGDAAEDYADDEAVEWLSRFSAVARRFS